MSYTGFLLHLAFSIYATKLLIARAQPVLAPKISRRLGAQTYVFSLFPPYSVCWSPSSTSSPGPGPGLHWASTVPLSVWVLPCGMTSPSQWRFYIGARGAKPPKSKKKDLTGSAVVTHEENEATTSIKICCLSKNLACR